MNVTTNHQCCGGGGGAGGDVVRSGYLKKLKTMRKKFFVLRAENQDNSSPRLEYYDTDKKFRAGQQPKRSISLKACFNINKRVDTKHKHVIALYTKDDCFCVVLDTEKDLDEWLKALLSLQHGEDAVDGEPPKPTFEHVWQVTMLNKGLGNSRNIIGPYHLCFTDKTLSLVRKSTQILNTTDQVEFSLMSIRRCGHSECFFYMEVGRSAITGAGELWMQTEDTNIAQSMGDIILRAMSNNNNKEDLAPKQRIRSSSANEASKPILMQRRQTHCGQKSTSYCSPSQDGVASTCHPDTSSGTSTVVGYSNISTTLSSSTSTPHPTSTTGACSRRHSVSAGPVTWSGMAHHQRTQSLPLAAPHHHHPHHHHHHHHPHQQQAQQQQQHPVENNNPVYLPRASSKRGNCNAGLTSSATNTTQVVGTARCMGGRERCDSMPSRARTSSEGTAPHPIRSHLAPHRPQSFYGRDISHSPPAGSPVSPASAACSTDSAGSSLSIDEPDAWPDYADTPLSRYGHSLTPDEPIVEEECDPYVGHLGGGYVPMAPLSSDDGYVAMSPGGGHPTEMSPAASSCSVTSGTPSTDMRFSEYHLEKVTSYFTPSEEDDSSERPHRAYSVGSRPDVLKLRTKLDQHDLNSRVRAFSVGSRSKGVHSRVLPPHGSQPPPCGPGGKSSSAPLLSSSQTSMERMDDLMEMDFSKPPSASGYVAMSPKQRIVPPGYVEMKPGFSEPPISDYMDMRPSTSPQKPPGLIKNNPYYVEMSGKLGTSPKGSGGSGNNKTSSPIQEEYMDMDFHQRKPTTSTSSSEGYMEMVYNRNKDYMNMNKKDKIRSQPITIQPKNSFAAFLQNTTRKCSPPTKHPPNYLPLAQNFNSPTSSPYSSLRRPRSRKSSRRDSLTTPTSCGEPSTIFPFSPGSPESSGTLGAPGTPGNPETPGSKCRVDASSGTVKIDEYVNFRPQLTEQLSNLTFMEDNNRLGAVSPRPGDTAPPLTPLKHETTSNAAGEDYELLKSQEIHYASLDLQATNEDEAGTSSAPAQPGCNQPATSTGGEGFTYAKIDFNKSKIKH